MNRMKTYENRDGFHTYYSRDSGHFGAYEVRSAKIHTGVCGVAKKGVYVTQVNAHNKSSARPGAREARGVC